MSYRSCRKSILLLILICFLPLCIYCSESVLIIKNNHNDYTTNQFAVAFENKLKLLNHNSIIINTDYLDNRISQIPENNIEFVVVFTTEIDKKIINLKNKYYPKTKFFFTCSPEFTFKNEILVNYIPLPDVDSILFSIIKNTFPNYNKAMVITDKINLNTKIGRHFNNVIKNERDIFDFTFIHNMKQKNILQLSKKISQNSFYFFSGLAPYNLKTKNNFDTIISLAAKRNNIPIFATNKEISIDAIVIACYFDYDKYATEIFNAGFYNKKAKESKAYQIVYNKEKIIAFRGNYTNLPKDATLYLAPPKESFIEANGTLVFSLLILLLILIIVISFIVKRKELLKKSTETEILAKLLSISANHSDIHSTINQLKTFTLDYFGINNFYAYMKDIGNSFSVCINVDESDNISKRNTDVFFNNDTLFDFSGNKQQLIIDADHIEAISPIDGRYLLLKNIKSLISFPTTSPFFKDLYFIFESISDRTFSNIEIEALRLIRNIYMQIINLLLSQNIGVKNEKQKAFLTNMLNVVKFDYYISNDSLTLDLTNANDGFPINDFKDITNINQLYRLLNPAIANTLNTELEDLKSGLSTNCEFEFNISSKFQETRWFILKCIATNYDSSGNTLTIEGIIQDITSYKLFQLSFIESERKFKTLFEQSNNGIMIIEQGIITETNRKSYLMLGYTKLQLLGKTLSELSPKKQADGIYSIIKETQIQKQIKNEKNTKLKWNFLHFNGKRIFTYLSLNSITYNDKDAIIAETTDITDIYEAQTKLIDSEKRFRNLSETANSAIFITWHDFSIKYMNPIAEKLFEFTFDEIHGRNVLEFLSPNPNEFGNIIKNDNPDTLLSKDDSRYLQISQIYKNRTKTGKDLWLSWTYSTVTDDNGNILEYYFIGNDITELKIKEQIIKENEDKLKTMLNSIADAVIAVNLQKQIILMNPIAEELTGYSFENCKLKSIEKVFSIFDSGTGILQNNPIEKVLETNENQNNSSDTTLISKTGQTYFISSSAAPLKDANGEIGGVILVFRDITFQYQAKEQLVFSEQRFRLFFEKLNIASLFCKPIFENNVLVNYEYLDCNTGYCNITGFKKAEIIGQSVQSLYDEIDNSWISFIATQLRENKNLTYERFFKPLNKMLYCTVFRILPEDENFWIVFSDVTDRTNMVKALRDSEEKYRFIMDNTSDRIMISYEDNRQPIVNKAYYEVPGYSWEDIYLDNLKIKTHPEDIHVLEEAFQFAIKNGKSKYQYRILHKNGSILHQSALTASVRNKKNEIIAYVSILRDITDLIKNQDELKKSQIELSEYNRNLEGIVDARTKEIVYKNKEIENTINELKQTESLLIQSEKMAALGNLIAGITHEINSPLGSISSSINSAISSLDKGIKSLPEIFSKFSVEKIHDLFELLSDYKPSNEIVSTREKRILKKKLIEVLTPTIGSDADSIAKVLIMLGKTENIGNIIPLFNSDDRKATIDFIENVSILYKTTETIKLAVERTTKVMRAMKNYIFTGTNSKMTLFDIREGMDIVLILYQNTMKYGITLEKKYYDIPKILCYPDELNQVWTNLIGNAIQAMKDGGVLSIDIHSQDDEIIVRIEDTGCGIENTDLAQIFKPFFTTKPRGSGTGIGLDISKQIVEKHNGRITVQSQVNLGSIFTVYIPIIRE